MGGWPRLLNELWGVWYRDNDAEGQLGAIMSSLWTPGGEIPVDRDPPPEPSPAPAPVPTPGPDPSEEDLEAMRREVLDTPASEIIVQHAMGFYELAALHLSAPEPRLAEARLAVDALTALVENLSGRLGPNESAIAAALPQLKMAYVEAVDRVAATHSG